VLFQAARPTLHDFGVAPKGGDAVHTPVRHRFDFPNVIEIRLRSASRLFSVTKPGAALPARNWGSRLGAAFAPRRSATGGTSK
jgi:hypothetical protein